MTSELILLSLVLVGVIFYVLSASWLTVHAQGKQKEKSENEEEKKRDKGEGSTDASSTLPPATKMEFAVKMTSPSDADKVESILKEIKGVSKWDIQWQLQQVIVVSTVNAVELKKTLETKTGLQTILRGQGAIAENLGCAYTAIRERLETGQINEHGAVMGVIRFVQLTDSQLLVEGEVDGLTPGLHGCHIHEFGDVSAGYNNLGAHYNPREEAHGGPFDSRKHFGDLGNIVVDGKGHGHLRVILDDKEFNLWSIIGRSVAIKLRADDLGRAEAAENRVQSAIDGNSGSTIACGIIARSSGVSQNPKKICTCSGTTLWESDPVDKYSA